MYLRFITTSATSFATALSKPAGVARLGDFDIEVLTIGEANFISSKNSANAISRAPGHPN